jgi:hypothetical protein
LLREERTKGVMGRERGEKREDMGERALRFKEAMKKSVF